MHLAYSYTALAAWLRLKICVTPVKSALMHFASLVSRVGVLIFQIGIALSKDFVAYSFFADGYCVIGVGEKENRIVDNPEREHHRLQDSASLAVTPQDAEAHQCNALALRSQSEDRSLGEEHPVRPRYRSAMGQYDTDPSIQPPREASGLDS